MIAKSRSAAVQEVRRLTEDVKLITFKDEQAARAKPGQFVMIWIPGVDEIPMSVSLTGPGDLARIIVKRVGEATTALHNLRPGDVIGVRGPYGNSFKVRGGRALVVAGGTGIAPLLPLARVLASSGVRTSLVFGAKSRAGLFLLDELERILAGREHRVLVATEDGSFGKRGLASDLAAEVLRQEKIDMIYTCGKELLTKEVFEIAKQAGVRIQASLERYMKCGIGICGHCVLDPLGLRVCRDGPVFDGNTLDRVTDFGAYRRDSSGRKIPIE